MKLDEVLIIGAGPAGMTAAIQLKRYGIPFVLLERQRAEAGPLDRKTNGTDWGGGNV